MRILQLIQKPQMRGAEIFVRGLSGLLRKMGHEVCLFYLYPKEEGIGLRLEQQDVQAAGAERSVWERFPGFHPGLLKSVTVQVRKFRPNVVQANGGSTLKYGSLAALLTPEREWSLVYRNIGDPESWLKGILRSTFYRKIVMPRVDGIAAVSAATLSSLGRVYGRLPHHAVIPRGVLRQDPVSARYREKVRLQTGTPLNAITVVFVGSLSREKRVDRLLKAVKKERAILPDGNLHLWILGDGPLRPVLESEVSALGLKDIVRFLGMQERVSDYMHAADLLALSSDTEGLPGVVLEAGACGLPVVATNVGGVTECIKDSETGYVVAPEDVNSFVDRITRLAANNALRTEMGSRARAFVESNFLLEVSAEKFIEFYKEVTCLRTTTVV
jgi:glycosyltransferase involved in cell wall biosynthesis